MCMIFKRLFHLAFLSHSPPILCLVSCSPSYQVLTANYWVMCLTEGQTRAGQRYGRLACTRLHGRHHKTCESLVFESTLLVRSGRKLIILNERRVKHIRMFMVEKCQKINKSFKCKKKLLRLIQPVNTWLCMNCRDLKWKH